MPRGPGKKENYNFDYSRFNKALEEDGGKRNPQEPVFPDDILRQLPGELQEAFRLMQVAKQSGDQRAQERANELALKAVERGGPEMKQRFQQELLRQAGQDPTTKKGLEAILSPSSKEDPKGKKVNSDTLMASADRMTDLNGTINKLHDQMQAGAAKASKQLEAMQKQQEALEKLQSPEDFASFMSSQGISEQDLQRIFSGDEAHMKTVIEKALGQTEEETGNGKKEAENLDALLGAVNDIHKTLIHDSPDRSVPEPTTTAPSPSSPSQEPKAKAKAKEAERPAPTIPPHRVQYQKDDNGKVLQVELKCDLPGVASMDAIELDLSEKYLRLRTTSPSYVVNVGPFPNLVDPSAARAKFSKKKQELSLTVPALP
mmetsp:Transcript_15307/g.33071  ORF Transcript_15307/g.33071 Transcript_15307/m.33071 type:complete len:373 (+) Transcript_15307:127-1245(+)